MGSSVPPSHDSITSAYPDDALCPGGGDAIGAISYMDPVEFNPPYRSDDGALTSLLARD